jgi:type I restriction enzyme, S subunit
MEKVKLGQLTNIKTGRLDVNAENPNGKYPFFTCSKNHTYIDEFAFDGESILVAGNGDLNVKYYNGKFNAYQRTYVIQANENLNGKFLYYFLNTYVEKLREQSIGGVIKYIKLGNLTDAEIPLPPLATQQRIATILDQADALIQNNRAIVQKYDALTQSLFLDMFGDPVRNEKGWEKTELGKLGDFKNGLNYSKSDNGFSLKVIGVGDFKNFSKLDDFSNTSFIEMNEAPRDEFLLKDGDLLFVRSNGNKELVGRCLIVYVGDEKVSYSGFCIRLRLNSNQINSNYLVQLLQRAEFKKHIFKNGRGANIQNINQELLNNIKIQIPPIDLQTQFAGRVVVIETQKQQAQLELSKSEALFQSLLQRAFKGEIR